MKNVTRHLGAPASLNQSQTNMALNIDDGEFRGLEFNFDPSAKIRRQQKIPRLALSGKH